MARRLALVLAVAAALVPAAWARLSARPAAPPAACTPDGRGVPPRGWVGCAADPGPRRSLGGVERLALGLPLDVNAATADALARVPGLTPRLAAAIVADRAERGPFRDLDDLERVRGVGPRRLARARSVLTTARSP